MMGFPNPKPVGILRCTGPSLLTSSTFWFCHSNVLIPVGEQEFPTQPLPEQRIDDTPAQLTDQLQRLEPIIELKVPMLEASHEVR